MADDANSDRKTKHAQPKSPHFLDLYGRAFDDVYSYVASRVIDRSTAEDVTQEVFITGARHIARGSDVDVAWLKTVARNKIIDLWRARAREVRKLALAYAAESSPVAPSPVADGTKPTGAERVTPVLADLNPTYRAALVLRHLDGLRVPEVAEILERSVEATEPVQRRLMAARARPIKRKTCDMIARTKNVSVLTLVLVLAAACGSDAGPASTSSTTSATSTQGGIDTTAPARPTPFAIPGLPKIFVSPTYGYSFGYTRGEVAAATELWDPGDERLDNIQFDDRFDAWETGLTAYISGASTAIPDGVSIDEWYDENVSPSFRGVPRSQQPEITIDGQSGRIAECPNLIEATVVAGGRLYLFGLGHERSDARAFFDAWVATIDLTPETAAVP